jgi:drug/metabolite transporter (DMT)-like permease
MKTNEFQLTGLIAGLGAASIWGGMYVVSKVVLDAIPPFTLLTLRLVIGIVTLFIFFQLSALIKKEERRKMTSDQVWKIFLVGCVGYGISLGFQFVGTKLSTASNGSLVTSATPAFILIFAPILLGEKTTTRRIAALIVSSLGVIAVIDPRAAELSPDLFWGNLALIAAALTWALYSVLARKVSQAVDVIEATMIMLMGGVPSGIAFSVWEIATLGVGTITPGVIGGVLFIAIVSTAFAMFLWNFAFANLPAAVASLTFFAQPVVGTLLGWFFLGEQITPLFLIGGAMIGIGLVIASRE